ncbi:MAG: MerR family transcriptional regulator [Betaproteobacteria bacterium]|nr:MAG: MerR family transcriptional regulator [Betaproteobacteria bacterium]
MADALNELMPIRTLSALTGVKPITLRAWERRYGLIRPTRTPKGHRLYSHQHVEEIRRVVALVDRGIPISQVKDLLAASRSATASESQGPWPDFRDRMAAAVARFDEPELDRIYDEASSAHSIDQITHKLLLPLLARLGERWAEVAGGVAEEHFFATYLRSKLGARLQHRMRYATGPRIVAACGPGEHHELGLLLFALEAQSAGLRTIVLGADTPLADLVVAARRSRADAVVVSSSVDPAPSFLSRDLPALVREAEVPVFVGGSTAVRHRNEITSAGAGALGVELEDGVRLLRTALTTRKASS